MGLPEFDPVRLTIEGGEGLEVTKHHTPTPTPTPRRGTARHSSRFCTAYFHGSLKGSILTFTFPVSLTVLNYYYYSPLLFLF